MKKIFFFFFAFLFVVQFASAQKGDLIIKSGDKGLYVEHKVAAKENFYSIGRLYNVSPGSIAAFNKIDLNKGLNIDQLLRIPLTTANFDQQGNSGTPVYYRVVAKDNLTKVCANSKVSLSNIKKWNKLTGDQIKEGVKLIVGFLNNKEISSTTSPNKPEQVKIEEKPEIKPVVNNEEKTINKAEEKPIVKTEEKVEIKAEVKPEIKKGDNSASSEYGYFKSVFEQQIKMIPATKKETVTSGIFKTESGWQDGKYYLLIDAVPTGTIVRVINPENNNAVYAKVLGEMSGIRQNEGLNIRISNAAAAALQIQDQDKFIVSINY